VGAALVGVPFGAVIGLVIAVSVHTSSAPATGTMPTLPPTPALRSGPSGVSGPAGPSTAVACGAQTDQTWAASLALSANAIYQGEEASTEVSNDRRQVTASLALASAVAAGERAQARSAVISLVFTPHLHIVRLRAIRNGQVLADVGAPLAIAPVTGTLTLYGHRVGRYVMSVQDDVGYIKLVRRFIGVGVELSSGTRRLIGDPSPGPSPLPASGTVRYQGTVDQVVSFAARGMPDVPIRVTLLVAPAPAPASLQALPCEQVELRGAAHVAQRVAPRFHLSSVDYSGYAEVLHQLTGDLVFIRRGGQQLAGSMANGPAPPAQDTLRFQGRRYDALHFTAPASPAPVTVLLLQPALSSS
jgi:hypothetical protein